MAEGGAIHMHKDLVVNNKMHVIWWNFATIYKDGSWDLASILVGHEHLGYAIFQNERGEVRCSTDTQGPVDVASCTPEPATAANNYVETTCPIVALGPTSDTLADVAEYYWKTDLRDPSQTPNRCTGGPVVAGGVTTQNNVCTNDTKYPRQYMSTYTLGLGASGLMQYQADYLTAASGDFNSVKLGLVADPSTGTCPWQTIGECNWPKPESNTQSNIDDLWHAAVNGRGTYFSATDPSSLAAGISGALQTVTVRDGALAAVTVTTANLAPGTYSGTLCVQSNDPDTPLVEVPVSFVVAVLFLDGFEGGDASGWSAVVP